LQYYRTAIELLGIAMFCIAQLVMPLGTQGKKLLFYITSTVSKSHSLKESIIHNQIYNQAASLILQSVFSALLIKEFL